MFTRSRSGFEQVMALYHLTQAQRYIQSLGFTNINNRPQEYRTTGLSADRSFYDPATKGITYGSGGVDGAVDAEVIWHEYDHAILDDIVPGFGLTAEAAAIGEGFGDYWAFTMASAVSPDTATTPWACIGDWDSTSYTTGTPHCQRRVDTNKTYPASLDGDQHEDGEIWSRALFDIIGSLGRAPADTVILQSLFSISPGATMSAAARAIIATAETLYGPSAADVCAQAFQARGIQVA